MYDSDFEDVDISPLHLCAVRGTGDEINRLVNEKNMSIDIASQSGWTPLHSAVDANKHDTTLALLALKASPSTPNKNGTTPLILAVKRQNPEIFQFLIEAGASLHDRNAKGSTALHAAVKCGNLPITISLLVKGADPSVRDNKGRTPLILAAKYKRNNLLQQLLFQGVSLDDQDVDGDTALHKSVVKKNSIAVEILCKAGADCNIPDKAGYPVAFHAVFKADIATLRVLQQYGADLNHHSRTGDTLLIVAAMLHHNDLLEYLIEQKVALDSQQTKNGNTALHAAVYDDNCHAVLKLCEAGASVDMQNGKDETPVIIAASTDDFTSLHILDRFGADLTIKSADGTALEVAESHGNFQMIESIQALLTLSNVFTDISPIEDALKCCVCLETWTNPVSLDTCGHSMCRSCYIKYKPVKCPLCRVTIFGVRKNAEVQRIIEQFKKVQSSSPCKRPRT